MRNTVFRLLCLVGVLCLPLAACGVPSTGTTKPGSPVYTQNLFDCNTGDLVSPGAQIEPQPGCDSWLINRYERPFNAGPQDEYYPDLDILSAALGKSADWFYLRLEIYDVDQESSHLLGVYGMEVDLDLDGRGDVLIAAEILDTEQPSEWNNLGVHVWKDADNDVGNLFPMEPDPSDLNDGYDQDYLDEEALSDEVWVRATLGKPSFVEIAFRPQVLENDDAFKWWAWVDKGVSNPAGYDYHDFFEHNEAGDVYQTAPFFPAKEIFSVDNTCAAMWGVPPPPDPSFCHNDPVIRRTPVWTRVPRTPGTPGTPPGSPTPDGTPTRLTPTPYGTPTRVTPTPTETPTPRPSPTPTPTNTPRPTRPPPPPPTATECRLPTGAPCP